MAHGTPDWGVTAGAVTTYQLTDLGELAVRLGSIDSFDRRGDVILLEDFEAGIDRWETGFSGTGGVVDLSTDRPRSGRFSVRLKAGSDDDTNAYISRRVPLIALSNIGLEASFSHTDRTVSELLRLDYDDESVLYRFELRWRRAEADIQILQPDGTYLTVATVPTVAIFAQAHSTMKLVVDLVNKAYVRAIFNRTTVDLSDYLPEERTTSGQEKAEGRIIHTGIGPGNIAAYYDDVILTQNEPA